MLYGCVFTGSPIHDRSYHRTEPAKRTDPIKTDPKSNNSSHLYRSNDHRLSVYDHPGSPLHLGFLHENPSINQGKEPHPL